MMNHGNWYGMGGAGTWVWPLIAVLVIVLLVVLIGRAAKK